MIDTYLLRGIAEIERSGSFTRAAEALRVSQPALSRAMQKLEAQLGVPLFERGAGRTALNATGRVAAEHARLALAALDGLAAAVRAADRARRVFRYGAIAPAPTWTLTPLFGRVFPGRAVEADILETDAALVEGLLDGSLEAAALLRPPENPALRSRPFLRERLGVLLPRGHRLAGRRFLRFADLAGETFLVHGRIGFWMPLCRAKIPGATFYGQESFEALREIAASSSLPSFYTDLSRERAPIPPDKVPVPLRDAEAAVTYHFAFPAARAAGFEPLFPAQTAEPGR